MTKEKTQKNIKRNIRSFEADDDVNAMLDLAQEDGVTLSTLCNLALRRHGPRIIREELEKQAAKALRWALPPAARAADPAGKQTSSSLPDPDLEKIVHAAEETVDKEIKRRPKRR